VRPRYPYVRIPDDVAARAYLAATIDSEGSICRHGRYWTIRVVTTSDALADLLESYGGPTKRNISPEITGGLGHLPFHSWHPTAVEDVLAILEAVEPYLLVKRDRALEALPELRAYVANAKMTRSRAAEIRVAEGSQREIARRFGVSQNLVSRIRTGRVRREFVPA
jgi:hypothetical protein